MNFRRNIKNIFRSLKWIKSSTITGVLLFFVLVILDLYNGVSINSVGFIFAIVLIVLNLALDRFISMKARKPKLSTKENFKQSPASLLLKITDLLPKKYREGFVQEISDMRLEYYEALSEKKIWRARCIVTSYYIGLSWSVVMWISDKVKEVVGIIPKQN